MLFGIILLTLGLLIILSQLVSLDFWSLLGIYWPIFFVVYGLYRLVTRKGSWIFSGGIILTGILFQLKNLGYIQGSAFLILLALGLVLLGLKIIIDDRQEKKAFQNHHSWAYNAGARTGATGDQSAASDEESDEENQEAGASNSEGSETAGQSRPSGGHSKRPNFFEEKDFLNDRFLFVNDTKVYRSDTFSGGQVEASFSDVTLDLKNVWPLENEIFMDVQVNFATLTLQVPPDWHVIVNNKHFYSARELQDQVEPDTTLIIRSREFMGTLKII